MRHIITINLRLGANIPMGVTFYDLSYETLLAKKKIQTLT